MLIPSPTPLPFAQMLRWQDVFAFVGPLGAVACHQHRAAALLLAADAPFRIRVQGGGWQQAHGAIVPPGLSHELDCGQQALAVIYFDPIVHGPILAQRQLIVAAETAGWVRDGRRLLWRLLDGPADDPGLQAMRQELLGAILPGAGLPPQLVAADARLLALREMLDGESNWNLPLPAVADRAGLSRFRFSHLFTEHIGIGWTAYRNWMRLIEASTALVSSPLSLTAIALDTGYNSAAHFSASFRGTFGITPSQLRQIRPQLVHLAAPAANI